jgi:hypothetical protein
MICSAKDPSESNHGDRQELHAGGGSISDPGICSYPALLAADYGFCHVIVAKCCSSVQQHRPAETLGTVVPCAQVPQFDDPRGVWFSLR